MIIFISGPDAFRSRQYLQQTIEEFKKKRDPQGYNVVILDSSRDEDKILGEIRTTPFLAEKRMIIISNILSSKNKDLLSELIEVVKNNKISETNIVVFWQGDKLGKVKEVKDLEKLLVKQLHARKFDLLQGVNLENWIKNQISERGGKIEAGAVVYLSQNAGHDMWFLNSLLDQLVAYSSSKIKQSDVQLFLDEKIDDNIFNMVEAIVSGNKKQALKLLNEQRRLGEDENKIFGLLIWQFKTLLEMKDIFDREDGIDSSALAKKLGIHPFVVKKSFYLIKRFTLNQLKTIHNKLLDIDIKTKTGLADQSLLVDLFVVT